MAGVANGKLCRLVVPPTPTLGVGVLTGLRRAYPCAQRVLSSDYSESLLGVTDKM